MKAGDRVITPTGQVGTVQRTYEKGEARLKKLYRYAVVRLPDGTEKPYEERDLQEVGRAEP